MEIYCTKCKQFLNENLFGSNIRRKNRKQRYCFSCNRELGRIWRYNNPHKSRENSKKWKDENYQSVKNRWLKRNYGITLNEYNILLKKQNNVCAICKKFETLITGKCKPNDLSVDHCHKTGKIRGLLCNLCNSGIGSFKDSSELCKNAAEYLNYEKTKA